MPYPVSFADDVLHMEYVGAPDGAAPQLAGARLTPAEVCDAWVQPVDGMRAITALHRDVCNVAAWFARHGVDVDPEEVFADLLSAASG